VTSPDPEKQGSPRKGARARLHADGGARGNPGPAGIGAVLVTGSGEVLAEISESIGTATNNVAEYKALIAGLEKALELGITEVDVLMDSELVVSQMKGEWKIKKETLRPLAMRASALLGRFASSSIGHVPRHRNADADRLANEAMDEAERLLRERGAPPGADDSLFG
jgi:ribonuclease H / adenosylcobalamin/alpha-ribazole phosphatase